VFAQNYPAPVHGDLVMSDFKFQSGETLPELKMHYVTLGTPAKDKDGKTTNAVLVLRDRRQSF
jgi:homoserine O-acetyltransferase